ncbi:MAG TPA: hypothetical protein VGL10_05095, partial [Gammaproteobacteria bacterium]
MASTMLAILISLLKTENSEASIHKNTAPTNASRGLEGLELPLTDETLTIALTLPPLIDPNQTESNQPYYPDDEHWQIFTLKPGQNLAALCARAGIKAGDVHALMNLGNEVEVLNKLYPNDEISLQLTADGKLTALRYDIHQSKQLLVRRNSEDANGNPIFAVETINRPLEIRTRHATGVIKYSLYQATQEAELSYQLFDEFA